MEGLIPLLIIVASGVISLVASARKQKRNNQTAPSLNEEDSPTGEQEIGQSFFQSEEAGEQEPNGQEEKAPGEETVEERKQRILEASEASADSGQQPGGEKPRVEKLSKTRRGRAKKRPAKKSSIEAIKEKFDVKEAIIYSEIINRKYF
ncbi:MAG: hypothetical protein KGY60_04210 [Bacteroidales bacterium]|nr:hypothetical protein [Bacteroidales bacterium]